MFNNALDTINEMFEMKQKYKDENGNHAILTPPCTPQNTFLPSLMHLL